MVWGLEFRVCGIWGVWFVEVGVWDLGCTVYYRVQLLEVVLLERREGRHARGVAPAAVGVLLPSEGARHV